MTRGSTSDIIVGDDVVKQDCVVGYYIPKEYLKPRYEWTVEGNPRVKLVEVMNNGNMCKVRVYEGAIGTYTVKYGDYSIETTIDWERNYIKGPEVVSSYEMFTYKAKGTFSLDTNLARIVSQDGTQCKIEILTGRKGEFTLTCETPDGEIKQLPIKIQSFTGGGNAKDIGVVS